MAKATASPPARRHNGDRLRGKAKPQRHQTKETPPPKHESAWKHENKPGLHSPFSLNQIGTLSRRHLAQFVSAIDISARLESLRTAGIVSRLLARLVPGKLSVELFEIHGYSSSLVRH